MKTHEQTSWTVLAGIVLLAAVILLTTGCARLFPDGVKRAQAGLGGVEMEGNAPEQQPRFNPTETEWMRGQLTICRSRHEPGSVEFCHCLETSNLRNSIPFEEYCAADEQSPSANAAPSIPPPREAGGDCPDCEECPECPPQTRCPPCEREQAKRELCLTDIPIHILNTKRGAEADFVQMLSGNEDGAEIARQLWSIRSQIEDWCFGD